MVTGSSSIGIGVPLALVQAMPGCQDLGGGYYRLPNIEWNKSSPLDGDDQYFMNLRHEMRMHGLFRGKRTCEGSYPVCSGTKGVRIFGQPG